MLGYVARSLFGEWVAIAGTFAIAKGSDPEELRGAVERHLGLRGAPVLPIVTAQRTR